MHWNNIYINASSSYTIKANGRAISKHS